MKRRATIVLIIVTAFFTALAAPASAKGAADGTAKVKLETKKTPAVVQGGQGWVALNWRGSGADASDFRVTATTKVAGVEISYPETTGGAYSSLMDDDVLSVDDIDFTALHLSVPYGTKKFTMAVTASWTDGNGTVEKHFKVQVPTIAYSGDDVALVTDVADTNSKTLEDGSSQIWVDVAWSGLAPSLSDVRMTVDSPDDIEIGYPDPSGSGQAWSGLARDDRLDQGETDVARFRLDPATMDAGAYELAVTLTYVRDGATRSTTGTITVSIGE